MRFFPLFLLMIGLGASGPAAAESLADSWNRITVPALKTSIYVGSVKLVVGTLERQGSTFTTTYEARVTPWFFWSENGKISISLTEADLANLEKGQTTEFTGDAINQRNKPRKVTGRAQPFDASSGKIKVRVMADGVELIFNGTYQRGS